MFSFFKKKEVKPGVKKYEIPEDEVVGIMEAADRLKKARSSDNGYHRESYAFWKKVEKAFPDLDIRHGNWTVNFNNPLRPRLEYRA